MLTLRPQVASSKKVTTFSCNREKQGEKLTPLCSKDLICLISMTNDNLVIWRYTGSKNINSLFYTNVNARKSMEKKNKLGNNSELNLTP